MEERVVATTFRFLDDELEVSPVRRERLLTLNIDGRQFTVEEKLRDGPRRCYRIDGIECDAFVARDGDTVFVHLDGEVWEVEAIDPIAAAGTGVAGTNAVRAPMPGVVVSIAVAPGDVVHSGQALMVIESMKLQTAIVADRDAVIETICFAEEATFDKGAELLRYADSAG